MEEDSDLEHFEDEDDVVYDPNAARDNYVPFSVEHMNNPVPVRLPNLI